jgi:hypothetical protein
MQRDSLRPASCSSLTCVYFSTLKMEEICSLKSFVDFPLITQCDNFPKWLVFFIVKKLNTKKKRPRQCPSGPFPNLPTLNMLFKGRSKPLLRIRRHLSKFCVYFFLSLFYWQSDYIIYKSMCWLVYRLVTVNCTLYVAWMGERPMTLSSVP